MSILGNIGDVQLFFAFLILEGDELNRTKSGTPVLNQIIITIPGKSS